MVANGQGTERADLLKKGIRLQYLTIGLNLLGALVAGVTGIATGSVALITFGLDSIIGPVLTSMMLLRLRSELRGQEGKETYTGMERKILFAVGVSFFLLALYSLNESGSRLYYREKPEISVAGLILSGLLLIGMPALAFMKFRIVRGLESRILRIDAWVTAVYAYLALVLFLGLGLNAWFGWWWVDTVSALLMLPLIVREGWEAVEVSKKGTHYESRTTRTGT
ncbi:MAG TPA: cation transporter [Nitrospirota bacterium]|nr:cation transporter [Nitrospirota bacterium]